MPFALKKIESTFIEKIEIINRTIRKQKNSEAAEFIVAYEKYLSMMNYSTSTIQPHLNRTKQFKQYFCRLNNVEIKKVDDFKILKMTDIKIYENHLIERIRKKEIKDETAYSCIKNIRLFLQFLNHNKVIDFPYSIPKKFMVKPTRLNTYVDQELITALILGSISANSDLNFRTLAILLLLVDTGCRPVEASNLKISDLNLTERKISFYSVKSGKRTLILSDLVIKVFKRYIQERNNLPIKSNHLFLKKNGQPIISAYISTIINGLNQKVFGKCIINARAIRHTYITNAIENNNEIKDVAETVGHKHWASTLYYLHRSEKRLLSNTLKFDPLRKFMEE